MIKELFVSTNNCLLSPFEKLLSNWTLNQSIFYINLFWVKSDYDIDTF